MRDRAGTSRGRCGRQRLGLYGRQKPCSFQGAWSVRRNIATLSKNAERIEGGEWKQSLQKMPPLPEILTEKQKSYVVKLGSAKGRDIVPINDLSLYRELMKLELIVDKGRRLALSSLGKDVYNHLV